MVFIVLTDTNWTDFEKQLFQNQIQSKNIWITILITKDIDNQYLIVTR